MCGIAGLIRFGERSEENIERMKERMLHRGPDAGGTWKSDDGEVVLGHRRLAIVDLSETGAQPMLSHSGRFAMVYNGEIYNHRELRQRLLDEKKVSAFRGTSDSEVMLEAFEAYGPGEALQFMKGMFAVALYDREEKKLQLFRDRIGEKPLYYGFVPGSSGGKAFAFASDLGCIACLDGFDLPVEQGVLPIYFTHGYIPAPYTIYKGIRKLTPGRILTIRAPFTEAEISEETYWSVEEAALRGTKNPFKGTFEEASQELERLMRASIRDQMVADVPVGAFLSAGIDSSTIVSLMQAESPGSVRSFTIGMEDPKYNEAEVAAQIAQHLGTQHTEMYITDQDAKAVIPLLPKMFAEPFADSSQIPTYLVSRMTRQHVTVSLSGDAGDELFCGYTSYASVERIWGKLSRIPAPLRKPASGIVLHSPLVKKDIYRIKGKLLGAAGPEEIYRFSHETDPLTAKIALVGNALPYAYTLTGQDVLGEVNRDVMLMDMKMYHPDDILVKVDRTAMAVSLETRVPLLDKDIVEFAWTLPIDYLRSGAGEASRDGKHGKRILRDILYRHVPRELVDRPKKGFSIPISKWLKEPELRAWAEELLDPAAIKAQGYLDADVVHRIWTDFTERGIWRIQIWYLLMFQAWVQQECPKACLGR